MLHQRIEIIVHTRGITRGNGQVSERVDDHAADGAPAKCVEDADDDPVDGQLDRGVIEELQSFSAVAIELPADLLYLVRHLRGILLEIDQQAAFAPAEALAEELNAHGRLSGTGGAGEERRATRPR